MGNSESVSNPSTKAALPPSNFTTGLDMDKQSFTWTIANFNVIRLQKTLIDSQRIDFTLGGSNGPPTKYTVRLVDEPRNGKRWIGIYLQPENGEPFGQHFMFQFEIKTEGGWPIKIDFGALRIDTTQVGYGEFIDPEDEFLGFFKTIVIHINFTLLTPSQPKVKPARPLEDILAKFQVTFLDQLRIDLAEVLNLPDPCTDIKLISNDKKEFTMRKGILTVRSEVFAAMLRSDMIEANSGVINLPDISSKALKVLLNFLKTGELLLEWSEPGVIVELTNAAEKYQLQDLLHFLDEAMGKVCQLENVGALATLARRLSLKVAEEELIAFVRKEGVGSMDKLIQMLSGELPASGDESDDDEPQAKRVKLN